MRIKATIGPPLEQIVVVSAKDMAEATRAALPNKKIKRTKLTPLTLINDPSSGVLIVTEARHNVFAAKVPAHGSWIEIVQVEGSYLAKLAASLPPETTLLLICEPAELVIKAGPLCSRIERINTSREKAILSIPSARIEQKQGE